MNTGLAPHWARKFEKMGRSGRSSWFASYVIPRFALETHEQP